MKKIFGIIGGLILLVIIIVIGVGVYCVVSIKDNTNDTKQAIIDENKNVDELISAYTKLALDDAKNDKVSFLLSNDDLDSLLYAISQSINIDTLTIKSIYATYNEDGTISLFAPVSCYGINSVVKGTIKMEYASDEFTITISDLSLGKLGINNVLIKNLVLNNLKPSDIEAELAKKDIYLSFEIEDANFIIGITNENIFKMIKNKSTDSMSSLYESLIRIVLSDDAFSLKSNVNDKTGFVLELNHYLSTLTAPYNLNGETNSLKSVQSKVVTLLNNKVINYTNVKVCFDYLVRGYKKITTSDQKIIDALDLSSVGISNKSSYEGIIDRSDIQMSDIINDNIPTLSDVASILITGSYDIKISEANLNAILNSLDFIGLSLAFTDGTGVSNITISNLFADIKENKLDLNLIVNIDGTDLALRILFNGTITEGFAIDLTLDKMYLGNYELDTTIEALMFDFIKSATSGDSTSFIKVDTNNKKISLDFNGYFTDNTYVSIMSTLTNTKTSLSNIDDGAVIITISK